MKPSFNANVIKLIAILAMTADHIAWLLFPGYPRDVLPLLLHTIGRITCPIMCFLLLKDTIIQRMRQNTQAACFCLRFFPILHTYLPLQILSA